MKKPIFALVGIIIVVAIVIALNTQKSTKVTAPNPIKYSVKQSCNILTKAIAQKIGGNNTTKQNSLESKSAVANLGYNSCTYGSAQAATTLLVHSASSKANADANAKQFGSGKPAGVKTVTGYGDSAYWDPAIGQLNILKNGTWYGISAGASANPTGYNLDQSKKLADLLANKL